MKKLIEFNLNHTILVKIKDAGYQHMADDHNSYIGTITNWERLDAKYFKDMADENGYTLFQAWGFMELF